MSVSHYVVLVTQILVFRSPPSLPLPVRFPRSLTIAIIGGLTNKDCGFKRLVTRLHWGIEVLKSLSGLVLSIRITNNFSSVVSRRWPTRPEYPVFIFTGDRPSIPLTLWSFTRNTGWPRSSHSTSPTCHVVNLCIPDVVLRLSVEMENNRHDETHSMNRKDTEEME